MDEKFWAGFMNSEFGKSLAKQMQEQTDRSIGKRGVAGNRPMGMTSASDWRTMFPSAPAAPGTPGNPAAVSGLAVGPTASGAPVAPATPTPASYAGPWRGNPVAPVAPKGPAMQTTAGTGSMVKQVVGLPAGQHAMSSFVPGQNAPKASGVNVAPAPSPLLQGDPSVFTLPKLDLPSLDLPKIAATAPVSAAPAPAPVPPAAPSPEEEAATAGFDPTRFAVPTTPEEQALLPQNSIPGVHPGIKSPADALKKGNLSSLGNWLIHDTKRAAKQTAGSISNTMFTGPTKEGAPFNKWLREIAGMSGNR